MNGPIIGCCYIVSAEGLRVLKRAEKLSTIDKYLGKKRCKSYGLFVDLQKGFDTMAREDLILRGTQKTKV
jgi:hypothetical protein